MDLKSIKFRFTSSSARPKMAGKENLAMAITLPDLPYDYDALQPMISAATLELHHGAHHRGYIEKLNALIKGTDLDGAALDVIVKRSARDAAANPASRSIFNN